MRWPCGAPTTDLGLEPADRRDLLLAALESDARPGRERARRAAPTTGSAASTPRTLDRVKADDRDASRRADVRISRAEHRMLHRDGSFRWMLARGLAVRDEAGKAYRMAGSQTDITKGKVADRADGSAEPDPVPRPAGRSRSTGRRRHSGLPVCRAVPRSRSLQAGQRQPRPRLGDQLLVAIARRLESCLRVDRHGRAAWRRPHARPPRRRRVHDPAR